MGLVGLMTVRACTSAVPVGRSALQHCPATGSCPALHCRAGSSPAASRHCSGSGGCQWGAPPPAGGAPHHTPPCRHPTAPTQRPSDPAAPHCTAAAEQPPTPTSATPRQPGPGSLVGRQCIALRPSQALQVLHALRLSVNFCAHEIGSFAFRMRAQPRTCMLRARTTNLIDLTH
jgi:hypothetical protein